MREVILILAPHTDDGEFGCGGTISRFLEEGHEVYYAAFSTCKNSVPEGMQEDILSKELQVATSVLGIHKNNIFVYDYPVREFLSHRQSILDEMLKISRLIEPTIVFAPSVHDVHQDHKVIAEEAVRAFKKRTLYAYEVPWNNLSFNNQVYYKLEQRHIEKKIEAISCYESQKGRDYASKDFTIGQAIMHGVQIGYKYAEVFEAVRCVY